MSFIVNQTFFVDNELELPNLSHAAELAKLNSFIAKFEPECLMKILGYPLFKLFGTETTQRMTDLLNGVEYTDGMGQTQKWQGLKHDTTISLIANYVWFFYQRALASRFTGTGTSVSKPEAGTEISPAGKMADAWNFFSSEVYAMTCFLWLKKDSQGNRVYPEFSYYQFGETKRIAAPIDAYFSF